MTTRERLELYDSLRNDESAGRKLLTRLRVIRFSTYALALVYIFLGAVASTLLFSIGSIVVLLLLELPAFIMMAGVSQFRAVRLSLVPGLVKLSNVDFVRIYEQAKLEAKENGCRGRIELTAMPEVNASIIRVGRTFRVNLGSSTRCCCTNSATTRGGRKRERRKTTTRPS